MQTVNRAIEAEYNNRVLVFDHPAIFEPWHRDSASFVDSTPCTLDIAWALNMRGTMAPERAQCCAGDRLAHCFLRQNRVAHFMRWLTRMYR